MTQRSDYGRYDDVAAAWQGEFPNASLDHFLLGASLMRIGRAIEKDLFKQAQRLFGISGAELVLLFALRRQGAPHAARPRTLSRALLITSGAVTKQIDRLEAKGLVGRADDPDSLNGQLISLTAKGMALTEAAVRHLAKHSVACEIADSLPPATVAGGLTLARAMIDALGKRDEGPPRRRRDR